MKEAILGIALFVSGSAVATVVELEDATAKSVIEVYEEMREEQQDAGPDNKWIHEFEPDPVGAEMDHLSNLKRTAVTSEEM